MIIWNKILFCFVEPEKFFSPDELRYWEAKVKYEGDQETDTHIYFKN